MHLSRYGLMDGGDGCSFFIKTNSTNSTTGIRERSENRGERAAEEFFEGTRPRCVLCERYQRSFE